MRAAAGFLAAIFGTLLLAALLAWPAWLLAHALVPEWPFHRVVSRFWQLLLLLGIVFALRGLGLRGREDWGYGLPRGRFLREAGAGLALGIATMLPMTLAMQALGLLALRPDFSATLLLNGVAAGALTGPLTPPAGTSRRRPPRPAPPPRGPRAPRGWPPSRSG